MNMQPQSTQDAQALQKEKLLRYLENATPEQQRIIFQRINASPDQQQRLLAIVQQMRNQNMQQHAQSQQQMMGQQQLMGQQPQQVAYNPGMMQGVTSAMGMVPRPQMTQQQQQQQQQQQLMQQQQGIDFWN